MLCSGVIHLTELGFYSQAHWATPWGKDSLAHRLCELSFSPGTQMAAPASQEYCKD